jgi:hypothetical protein
MADVTESDWTSADRASADGATGSEGSECWVFADGFTGREGSDASALWHTRTLISRTIKSDTIDFILVW